MEEELKKLERKKLKELMKRLKKPKEESFQPTEIVFEANDENFQTRVVEASKKVPVVVDFWAKWCRPCKILSPTLESLAREYNGKFLLGKLNTEKSPITAATFLVMSIPSVKMFKDGKVVDSFTGVLAERKIREWLDKNLNTT